MWRFNGYALTCPEGGIWGARSDGRPGNSPKVTYGPDGLSECLPEGLYLILRREFVEIKDEKGYYNDPGMYLPEKNEGWFVPLRPLFYTERGTPEKGRFGIHPDGEAPGTNGCIGVFSGDYAKLLLLLVRGSFCTHLEVKYSCCCVTPSVYAGR